MFITGEEVDRVDHVAAVHGHEDVRRANSLDDLAQRHVTESYLRGVSE